jgi:hypothetical protein
VTAPGLNASYDIGPDGTRFKKTVNGNITDFTYGPNGMLLTELQRNQGLWTHYLWLDGRPVALMRDIALYWIQTDHLGRPEGLTDSNKQRVCSLTPCFLATSVIGALSASRRILTIWSSLNRDLRMGSSFAQEPSSQLSTGPKIT